VFVTESDLSSAPAGERRVTPYYLAMYTLGVFVATWACIVLVHHTGRISALWVPNAVVFAAMLKREHRAWPTLVALAAAANFAADLLLGDSVLNATGFSLANASEVMIVALPLRWLGFGRVFSRTEVLLTFYGLVVAGCVASSAMAAGTLVLSSHADFWDAARSWFGADALGMSLLAPFMMCVRADAVWEMFSHRQRGGTFILLAAVLLVGYACYALPTWSLSFLYVPVLLLLTFRRGFAGGALGLFLAVVVSLAIAVGHPPSAVLAQHSAAERIAIVQLYYAVIGFTIILAGANLDERRALERNLALAASRAEAAREEAILAKDIAEKASHAKSSFLANMSHELRTPLNAVLGFSEIIASELYGPVANAQYKEYAGLINGAGKHLLDLIGDILDMSKIEAGKVELHRERFNAAGLVRECFDLMAERAASGGVALDIRDALTPVFVNADKRAVKQILLNLLSNAVKFTPAGGTVAVRLTDDGTSLSLAVADTGVGIAAAEIDRLGNPFVQLANSSNHAGTGLGLALVKGLAELHGGAMRIKSSIGHGTTVTVALPLRAPAADSLAA
jgi:signal transduction histidine kinase